MRRVPRHRRPVHKAPSFRPARRKKFLLRRRRRLSAKVVRTARQFDALSRSERVAYRRVLDALSLIRHDKLSLAKAALQAGTTPVVVMKYTRTALRRNRRGRIAAKPADRLYRPMRVLTADGLQDVGIRGSRAASVIGEHWNATRKYLETGDESGLRAFSDTFPGGKRLATDPAFIDREARRGELDFEDIYHLTT